MTTAADGELAPVRDDGLHGLGDVLGGLGHDDTAGVQDRGARPAVVDELVVLRAVWVEEDVGEGFLKI